MTLDRYYYITSLPTLGELGSTPPIAIAEMREYLGDDPRRQEIVSSLFLHDDLVQREAFLAGELHELAPAVLSEKQIRDEAPLPSYLVPKTQQHDDGDLAFADSNSKRSVRSAGTKGGHPADAVWGAYFRHVAITATRFRCEFLATWVRHEVGLRNGLTSVRAKRLGLDESEYLVATGLSGGDEQMTEVLSEWEMAATPLAGQQMLLRFRWAWLAEHVGYYSFRNDELAAYALRLMLLHRWHRISVEDERQLK